MQDAVSHEPSVTESTRHDVLVVAADPTVRAALVALCRTTTGRTVRDARSVPANLQPGEVALVVVDPGDATHGVARTVTTAAAFVVPVLVIPPVWRDALLAGALGDSARIVPEIAAVVAAAMAAGVSGEGAPVPLGERERAVVVMTFYDEQTSADLAGFLGVSEANVRVIRHRAIQQLRQCMGVAA